MQRHTLTFRSKKRTKKVVFVNFDIFVYFRIKIKKIFGISVNSATLASE